MERRGLGQGDSLAIGGLRAVNILILITAVSLFFFLCLCFASAPYISECCFERADEELRGSVEAHNFARARTSLQ